MAEQVDSWLDLPAGTYEGVNRYSTDDEEVLSLWRAGQTWDLRAALAADTEPDPEITEGTAWEGPPRMVSVAEPDEEESDAR